MPHVTEDIAIQPARPDDAESIRALPQTCGLPVDDVESHLGSAVIARQKGIVVGSAALDLYRKPAVARA